MGYRIRFGLYVVISAMAVVEAVAQTVDTKGVAAGGLEEIIVTSTRREERLQDVPISVTAFTAEKLDAEGLKNIDDLSRMSPGLTFQRNGMGSSANYNDEGTDVNFRGVDSTAGTSTTGIYIDDTPVQTRHIGFGSVNPFPQLFDVERVEVLRGPQGTLFGAGAEGGALRFISPEPSLTKDTGYARADLATTRGGDKSYEGGLAFGGPIINDVLGFRLSASFRRDGGWVDRVGYGVTAAGVPQYNGSTVESNSNWSHSATIRAALTWKVADGLEITPSIFYQELHLNDTAAYWVGLSDPGAGTFRNGNRLTNWSVDPFTLSSIKVKWDLSFAQLISNTSYFSRDQRSISDYTQYLRASFAGGCTSVAGCALGSPYPTSATDGGYAPFRDKQSNFYQEIRLSSNDPSSRILWSAGLFYSQLRENVFELIYDPTLDAETSFCAVNGPCPGGLLGSTPLNKVTDTQVAGFGELTFKFTDTLKATAGLRVSKLKYSGSTSSTGPFYGPTFNGVASASENPVTPKLVLSWEPERDNLVYVSAAKGFRPGGVNFPAGGSLCGPSLNQAGLTVIPGQYSSDSLWSYEIGSKNLFFDHTLQVNASIFDIEWSNIQTNYYLASCGEQFAANLGKAKSAGGEIEVTYRPAEVLTFSASAAYTDAKYASTACAGTLRFDGSNCVGINPAPPPVQSSGQPLVTKGDRLLGAPWSFAASTEYHFAELAGHSPYVRVDYQHTTAQYAVLSNHNVNDSGADPTVPGLPISNNLSLRAGVRFNGFDVSVYGNNLTNSHPLMFESRDVAAPSDPLYFGRGVRPLTIGVTGTYRY